MKRILMLAALVTLCFSAAQAQNEISLEQVAGTVDGNIQIGTTVNFQLRVTTATDLGLDKLSGTTIGFRLYSPAGASWTGTTGEFLPAWPPQGSGGFDLLRQVAAFSADGIGADTIAFNNSTLFGAGAPAGYDEVAWQINAEIPNDPGLHNQEICIDSCSFVGPARLNWLWNDGLGNEIFPAWAGEQCFTIVDPNAAGGELVVTPDTLTFTVEEGSGDPAGQTFTVSEGSGGNIPFAVSTGASWLAVLAQGSATPADVDVDVITSGLGVGTYFDSVEVSSGDADNSPVYKYVSLEVTTAPTFNFTPDTLFFEAEEGGPNPTNQNIDIDLSDASARSITLTSIDAMVSVDPTTGSTPLTAAVGVDITGLTPGVYTDSVMVSEDIAPLKNAATAEAGYFYVVTTITEPPYVLQADPTSLAFNALVGDGLLPDRTVIITEQLGRDVATSATNSESWMQVNVVPGGDGDSIFVQVNVTGLTEGVYEDTIVISAPEADADIFVPVTLTITAAPEFVLSEDTLFFSGVEGGPNPGSQTTDVSLSDAGSVGFDATSLTSYVTVDPTSATTPATLTVSVDISALTEGMYEDSILISEVVPTEKGAEQAADVYVIVMTTIEAPVIDLVANPLLYEFTATEGDTDPQTAVFTVTEAGGGAVNFTTESALGSAWLTFDTTGTTPDSVNIAVDPTGLAVGNYHDSLRFIAEGGADTATVVVNLSIEEFICTNIILSDTLLTFSAFEGSSDTDPALRTLAVTGSEQGINFTFDANVEVGVDWVTLINAADTGSLVTGSNGDILTVLVDPSALTVGNHFADILVMSESPDVCAPGLRVFTVQVTVNEVIVPSDDTVRVVNTPAVPGMRVTVPVDLKSSCNLISAKVDLAYDAVNLVFDSASFESSVFGLGLNEVSVDGGVITVQSNDNGMTITPVEGNWVNLHFTVMCEALPGVYNLAVTDAACDTLTDTCGLFFVRNCGEVSLEVPEFEVGGIVVDNVTNYVCGYVVDTAGNEIEGATVQLWGDFPVGLPIDEMLSTGIGSFAFSDFSTIPFSLYAYKEGYYPTLAEGLNFGDKGIMLVLTPLPDLIPTSEWVDYFCNTNTFRGQPLPVGAVVEAYANGLLVGRDVVETEGSYGFMPVYRDDFTTGEVDGAVAGDNIMFMVNGQAAVADGNTIYPAEYQQVQVCLSAGDQVTQECELSEGWNLVSWRVQTESSDIMDVLGPYMNNIDVVLGFERGGLTYDPELPEFSTLWTTDHLSGYWIRVKEGMGFTLEINGTAVPVSTPIPVTAGWNLVSYLPDMAMAPADALVSLDAILLYAYGWDGGILTYEPGSQFSNLTQMMTCNGYWVKVSANGELVYPSGGGPALAANIIPTRETVETASSGFVSDVKATTQWMNLYSRNLTLDGSPVTAGTEIAAHRADGMRIGSFVVRNSGEFGFMPVYGSVTGDNAGIKPGEEFYLTVGGRETKETFTWTSNGDRMEIGNLSAASLGGDDNLPDSYDLAQNYPNPFNPTTTISFTLPTAGKVKLEVYNILGKLVATPFDGPASSGTTEVVWDGRDLRGETVSSGVYFYRLTTDTFTDTKKMMLLK